MSLLRLGRLPDGTRHTVEEGPARARVSGYGHGNTHDLTLIGGAYVQGDPGEVARARKSQAEYMRRHRR